MIHAPRLRVSVERQSAIADLRSTICHYLVSGRQSCPPGRQHESLRSPWNARTSCNPPSPPPSAGRLPRRWRGGRGGGNRIGEHVDYCGLAVFPMAIQREVRVRFRPRADGMVRVVNAGKFERREFPLEREPPPYVLGDWGNYLKAAARGLVGHYGISRGMDALIWSDLPIAAGLSSSSALVVAAALALLDANGIAIDRPAPVGLPPGAEGHT